MKEADENVKEGNDGSPPVEMREIESQGLPFTKIGTPEWIEKVKKRRAVNGSKSIVDKKAGFLDSGKENRFGAKKKTRFLELFAEDKPMYECCRAVGVTRNVVYSAIAIDAEFRRQYLEIDEAHTDDVEAVLRHNAKTNKWLQLKGFSTSRRSGPLYMPTELR